MKSNRSKPFAVKFPRNPQFTPAAMTDHQLTRIEQLALAYVYRTRSGCFDKRTADEMVTTWMNDHRRTVLVRPGDPWSPLKQSDAARAVRSQVSGQAAEYFANCLKWVIAYGLRGGWLKNNQISSSRSYWAQVRGSY